MLAELKKVRGIAIGITGFNAQGQPEYALVIVTGDSQTVGIAVRAYLTLNNKVRNVGTVGAAKVPVYQYRMASLSYDERGQPKLADDKPTEVAYETTLAYTPGLFVVGSSKAAVGEVVSRFLGETKGGLSDSPEFKTAASGYRQPGVFFYADVLAFCSKYDAGLRTIGGGDPDYYAWFKLVAGAKAIKTLAGSIKFQNGGLAATVGMTLDPTAKSPLAEFLAGSGVNIELLHPAQRPAGLAFAVTLPEKNRAAAAIGFLDALAKSEGELGRLPSEAVKELEAKYKMPLKDGLLGKTRVSTKCSRRTRRKSGSCRMR